MGAEKVMADKILGMLKDRHIDAGTKQALVAGTMNPKTLKGVSACAGRKLPDLPPGQMMIICRHCNKTKIINENYAPLFKKGNMQCTRCGSSRFAKVMQKETPEDWISRVQSEKNHK